MVEVTGANTWGRYEKNLVESLWITSNGKVFAMQDRWTDVQMTDEPGNWPAR